MSVHISQSVNILQELNSSDFQVRKLQKQAQSKDVQHEHEVKRIMQNSQKLQEQLQKSVG